MFNISIQVEHEEITRLVERFKNSDQIITESVVPAGEETSGEFLARMKRILEPGGEEYIGATGASAKNIAITNRSISTKQSTWTIRQGSLTKGNYFIRKGSSGGSRKDAPIHKIKEWILAKNIPVYAPPYGTGNPVDSAARAIAASVNLLGVSQFRLRKKGNKSFDYMDEVVNWEETGDKYRVRRSIRGIWSDAVEAIVERLFRG